ncbi:Protein-tyrosine-phosphatase MKP1 [Hibiscus syriacus]|uniref:Protein-tyrosine-phosphatase MKP1 n=1 Tax=Hibiscus syriacus TaxID=106335 RepID=A0A6A3A4X7_HIBSY|nr:Protein-tyrosine-phosphatase MKP1 [Hibiscus syriacus]
MLSEEEKDRHAKAAAGVAARKPYLRSVSWNDRSPGKPHPKPPMNAKGRSCLPPLSITRRPVEEWPKAGSDDLGVWPNPQTPRASVKPLDNPGSNREFLLRKDKLAFFDKECSRIAEHVYLGSDAVAKNREILRTNGITHVLNCVGFVCPEYFKHDLVYKTLWLQDTPSEDITSILYDVFDYFEDVREQGGKVLVHCCQGVSRSSSLVIAYLMWREGQSFEDAFQYVKAARGVTNPNTGFAFQLLQCQKRVHAVPASPNSVLRMYRMAPHSPYDALHLVPKMVDHPSKHALDSRGAFVVHVPCAVYVWVGKRCSYVMSNSAASAANQVIRYEQAKDPFLTVREGDEPLEFWDALASGQLSADGCNSAEGRKVVKLASKDDTVAVSEIYVGQRKVDDYDLDFELYHKALAGGVVPPFSVSNTESETCLPARENGWGRLRQKFASGIMKEFVKSSKLGCNLTPVNDRSDVVIDTCKDKENTVSFSSPSSSSIIPCGSPDSFDCSPYRNLIQSKDPCDEEEQSSSIIPCGSPDSIDCSPYRNLIQSKDPCDEEEHSSKFSSKSPSLSPSTSDYASSFTFSPSSSNWSSQQPSPSGLEATDLSSIKHSSTVNSFLPYKESFPSLKKSFSSGLTFRVENPCLPCKGTSPSLAERRGSHPPPRMWLPSADAPVPRKLVKSWSFSLPDLDDTIMNDLDRTEYEPEDNREELMLDVEAVASIESHSRTEHKKEYGEFHAQPTGVITSALHQLYQWPSLNNVKMDRSHILESTATYMLLASESSSGVSDHSSVLYVWLGRKVGSEEEQSQLLSCDGTHRDWESIGRDFLNKMDFPLNASIQIVREGEEPEQFLNLFDSFIIPKG